MGGQWAVMFSRESIGERAMAVDINGREYKSMYIRYGERHDH